MAMQDARSGKEQLTFGFYPQLPMVVQPAEGDLSSDAGLLPIREFDGRWDFTRRMARCLEEPGQERPQSLLSMLRQRVYGILAGYEDCNDHDTLRTDRVFKLVADRRPEEEALASQPTLSRFENHVTAGQLLKVIDFLIDTGIEHLKQRNGGQLPASITLDLDATDDPTHGQQSGSSGTGRILRPIPILPPGDQRADQQACVCRLAAARHGARRTRGRR